MEIKTLAQLGQLEDRSGRFSRYGFMTDRVLKPDAALQFIQGMVASYDLVPAVPEVVREYFEHSRLLHVYGAFVYQFFTLAQHHAYLAIELALGVRFVEAYQHQVSLLNHKSQQTAIVDAPTFQHVADALYRTGPYPSNKGWGLPTQPAFNGSLHSLFTWARAQDLLSIRRTERWEEGLRFLRNFTAHPTSPLTSMPPDSALMIEDAAAFINRLWGVKQLYVSGLLPSRFFPEAFVLLPEQFLAMTPAEQHQPQTTWRLVYADRQRDVARHVTGTAAGERPFLAEDAGEFADWAPCAARVRELVGDDTDGN